MFARICCFLLCAALAFFPAFSSAQSVDDLLLFTEDYPPYSFVENGVLQGSSVEVVLAILERLGSTLGQDSIRVLPWARAYRETLTQPNTVLFSTYRSKEREHLFKWACPLPTNAYGLIARKDAHIVINGPADMMAYRVGVVRQDIGQQKIEKLLLGKRCEVLSKAENGLLMLKEGRLDLFATDLDMAYKLMRRLDLAASEFEMVYNLLSAASPAQGKSCIAFHRDTDDELVEAFQRELDALRR